VAHEQLTMPKESKNEKTKNQNHANLFFRQSKRVHEEFVPQGQTVNKHYYRGVLERLIKRVHHRVWPETVDTWMLHHDNAPCHTATSANEFLAKKVFQWFHKHRTRLI
jgi:hypothetical protein